MKNKINEIARGKNLETNIPAYAEYMMNVYNKSANVQFTMNYYTYYEVIAEYAGNNKKEIEDILLRLNALVDKCVINTVSILLMSIFCSSKVLIIPFPQSTNILLSINVEALLFFLGIAPVPIILISIFFHHPSYVLYN